MAFRRLELGHEEIQSGARSVVKTKTKVSTTRQGRREFKCFECGGRHRVWDKPEFSRKWEQRFSVKKLSRESQAEDLKGRGSKKVISGLAWSGPPARSNLTSEKTNVAAHNGDRNDVSWSATSA